MNPVFVRKRTGPHLFTALDIKEAFSGEGNMKKCPNCGKELPDASDFCPYCETQLLKKKEPEVPRKRNRKVWAVLILLIFAAAAGTLYLQLRPREYKGASSISYTSGGNTYNVFLTFFYARGIKGEQQAELTDYLGEGVNSALPSLLFAMKESSAGDTEAVQADAEAFMDLVESCHIDIIPQGDVQGVELYGPSREPNYPAAVQLGNLMYNCSSGANKILWTITMKNHDRICLSQTFTCFLQNTVTAHYDDTPLNTVDEIQNYLDQIPESAAHDIVELYLAPSQYRGTLTLKDRAVLLYGTEENGTRTTFTDTLQILSRDPTIASVEGIDFIGSGTGAGLQARAPVFVDNCTFENWEQGVYGMDGSWPMIHSSTFRKNKTGFLFESSRTTASELEYSGNTFTENGVAVFLKQVPGEGILYFIDNTFRKNGTDIENLSKYAIQEE